MNYDDFDKHVHALVLEQGWDYFDKRAVSDLTKTDAGWKAVVSGQKSYQVNLNGTEGLEGWICDCPYDHGPVCKHVAATLYAVKERISTPIATRLEEMSEKDLRNVILAQALRSRTFREAITEYFKD